MKVKDLLAEQIRLRDDAIENWEKIFKEIKDNPNQTNIRGIWIDDMLKNLSFLRTQVLMRDELIQEMKRALKRTSRW